MKILILTNYANGLFLFRKELLKAFTDEGHEVLVSVPRDDNCTKLEGLGVTIIDTPLERHGMNPLKDLKLFFRYISMIKEVKPQLILTYTIKPDIYGAMAARFLHVPYICNVTGLGMAIEHGGMLSKVLLKLYSLSMGKARKVFFQNERNMKFMQDRGVAKKNAAILPGSGVNLNEHPFREYPSEKEGIHFLSVIRIMKDKGIEEFLEAAEMIKASNPEAVFDLVGEYEEDEREKYEPRLKDLEERGIIKYYGHLDTVEPVMAKSHVIIHPSYHEGLSNVLLEAAACGRPVLATNIHGCIETFDPGVSGIAFEARDSKALVTAIEEVLSFSEEERRTMGAKGRKWVEDKFDRQIVIDAYMQELSRL